MMANSSPPSRASVSVSRNSARSRVGDGDQQPVADGMAERVVDLLEPVEIEAEQGEALAPRRARASASSIFSRNRLRLGRPVSES